MLQDSLKSLKIKITYIIRLIQIAIRNQNHYNSPSEINTKRINKSRAKRKSLKSLIKCFSITIS